MYEYEYQEQVCTCDLEETDEYGPCDACRKAAEDDRRAHEWAHRAEVL